MELTERSTYEELIQAYEIAEKYGCKVLHNNKIVQRLCKKKTPVIHYRTKTPEPYKLPVIYKFIYDKKDKMYVIYGNIVIKGREGEAFTYCQFIVYDGDFNNTAKNIPFILHSHAINRYIERRKFVGTIEEAQLKILDGISVCVIRTFDGQHYLYFDDGVFLCTENDAVVHIRTYITNAQCYQLQRLESKVSEMSTIKAVEHYEEFKQKFFVKNT